jgi:dyslexia susceptibility 1 candidate gene 1 protein
MVPQVLGLFMHHREQREEEIRLYKKTNAIEGPGDTTDISERQPVFLKDKGDAMFKQGNYR